MVQLIDFLQAREIDVSLDEYFKYLMLYKDLRFSRDPRFRYYALNIVMHHRAITETNIYINKHKFNKITIEELR